MSKRATLVGWLLPLILGCGACKKELATASTSTPPASVATPVGVEVPLPPADSTPPAPEAPAEPAPAPKPVARGVDVQNLVFDYLQLKGRMQFDNGNDKVGATLSMRLKRDSVIWVSVIPALGIEAARLRITRDSVLFINRLQKTYFAGDFAALQARYQVPVDFAMLQAALVANYLPAASDSDATVAADASMQVLRRRQDALTIEQVINRDRRRMVKLSIRDRRTGDAMTANYDDFRATRDGERDFPFATLLSIQQSPGPNAPTDQIRNILISLNHKTVTVPEGKLDFPFAIPPDYERK